MRLSDSINIRLSTREKQALAAAAERAGRTLGGQVRFMLRGLVLADAPYDQHERPAATEDSEAA